MTHSFKKSALLFSSLFVLHNVVYAKSLDDMSDAFFETQTGSHLRKQFPNKKLPSQAFKRALNFFVTRHRDELEKRGAFDYTKKKEEINAIYKQAEPLLIKETEHKDTHIAMYTAYSPAIGHFNSFIGEANKILSVNETVGNPLHHKTPEQNKIKNRTQFLRHYFKEYKKHIKNCSKKGQKLKLFNSKRRSGCTKAVDGSEFFRVQGKCANLSFWGNVRRGTEKLKDPYENSPFWWMTGSNVGQFNDTLTINYKKAIGTIAANAPQAEIDGKLAPYKQAYAGTMAKGGGEIMQILIKKELAEKNLFFSFAKGLPCYIDVKTGKLATRGHDRPVTYIGPGTKRLKLASVAEGIDLYKKDPEAFEKIYGKGMMDNVQARVVVNPAVFANKEAVITTTTTRYEVSQADQKDYNTKMRTQFSNDLAEAVRTNQMPESFSKTCAFGTLKDFVLGKRNISDLPKILVKASKQGFAEACAILKKGTATLAGADKKVASRMSVMERISNGFDKLKQMSEKSVGEATEALKKLL